MDFYPPLAKLVRAAMASTALLMPVAARDRQSVAQGAGVDLRAGRPAPILSQLRHQTPVSAHPAHTGTT